MEASEKEKDASSLPPPSTSTSTTATIELPVEQERVVATTQRFLAALKHRQKERDLIDTIRAEHQDQQQQQRTALLPSPPTSPSISPSPPSSSLLLEATVSSRNKDTADNSDNNNTKNNDRVYDYQPKAPYPAWDYNWDGRMTSETTCEALSDLATFRKIKTTNNNNAAVIPPPSTTTKRNEEDGDDNNNGGGGGGGGGSMTESVVATAEAGTVNDVVVRHIILVRHGQYDESSDDDAKRSLTKIGRQQAKLTGQRLASMLMRARNKTRNNNNMKSTPCTVTKLHTSDMTRAKETAHIIAHYLPMEGDDDDDNGGGGGDDGTIHIKRMAPDPLLNETLPAPMIPIRPDVMVDATVQDTIINANHHKVEEAFQKYFYRQQTTTTTSTTISSNSSSSSSSNSNNNMTVVDNMDDDANTKDTILIDKDVDATKQEKNQKEPNDHEPTKDDNDDDDNDDGKEEKEQSSAPKPNQKHEFEIIVCHGNIIRYMFCRALQLPPECWLRMSIFNCSLTYIMIPANGYATCRFLGDIGHLPYDYNTIKNNDSDDDGNGSGNDNGDDSNDDENKNENDDSDCSDVVTFSGNYGFNWW